MSGQPQPAPIVVLVSGRGTNLHALIDYAREASPPYVVRRVFSDNSAAAGLVFAREAGIAARAVPAGKFAGRADYERSLAAAIDECQPELIVLAGYMRILSPEFVARYDGKIFNIHPSLLPNYPGLHTHRRVLAAGDPLHGATVHFVTAELDCGPPIIQAHVKVLIGDDEHALAARVLSQEHKIYPLAVKWYCQGRLNLRDGRAWLDGAALTTPVIFDEERPVRNE